MQKCPCDAGFPWRHLPCCMEKSRFCLWTCSSVSSFSGIFFGFFAFRGRNFGRDFPAGWKKWSPGSFFFVFRLAQNWPFSGNSCPPVGKKRRFLENFCSLDDIKLTVPGEQIRKIRDFFVGGRNGLFQAFLSVPWKKCPWLRISFTVFRLFLLVGNGSSTCFFLCAAAIPLCVHASSCLSAHARMCAYTRPRARAKS